MRGFLASSIGVSCAVLALPLAPPAAAAGPVAGAAVPGSTQSLPLAPLTGSRAPEAATERGLAPQTVRSFSLVGVVWDDPAARLHGHVRIRTRANGTGRWSGWQELEVRNEDHGPDPGTREGSSRRMRGATAPLWVGASDGVQVSVRADEAGSGESRAPRLPDGLHVELVDPGRAPGEDAPANPANPANPVDPAGLAEEPDGPVSDAPDQAVGAATDAETITSAVEAGLAPLNGLGIPGPWKGPEESRKPGRAAGKDTPTERTRQAYAAPRPRIVSRSGWGADESLREPDFLYTDTVKAAFVHHTATGNNYTCAQAPSVIRSIYRYHVVSSGWRDIGYNFLVDRCGTIYEGRAGGVEKPVQGAHTLGFNGDTTGIAVIGTYSSTAPTAAAVDAIARLTAWKLGLFGVDPRAKTYLESGGGNLYPKGENVRLNVISGHRDGFATECPGRLLYGELGLIRLKAARYQGR
ncbi:peptidoglycan recognition protein family protein [Streptomyces sp. NPDC004393]|uniref:peptidoglycan recognition protein family protein n=1 Tax=Streptomyces sp. NPDC004533 TaxID=3154278 RepID=UPI0033B6414C